MINKLLNKLEGNTFIIIDECHNLSNSNLTDVNNEIYKLLTSNNKILFVSATPKQYSNETINDYSNIFGNIRYTLEWKYAIENKYICDYNFYYPNNDKIIEYITNIKFDTSIIEKTILINKAFFLLESIKSLTLKKCIVYLKTIKEADLFENILKTINIYFEFALGIYNINYNTSRTKRNISLTKFRNNKTKISIMLNVHILDEGIDIPECDSVYLTHPNNNPVNIIQRISRANRISTDKTKAYILLWSKNQINLENIIKQIKEYIPVNFHTINSNFINNRIEEHNEIQINNQLNNHSNQNRINESLIIYLKNNSGINETFIDFYFSFYNNNDTNNFIIDINIISKLLNIVKGNIKKTLTESYKINIDYKLIISKQEHAGRPSDTIFLTPECVKRICILSKSSKGDEIRSNYNQIEKHINKYKDTIINNLSNNL